MELIIAAPSPFARKVRVALREKGIDHAERMDTPWNPGAAAAAVNPLGKVPVLLPDDGPPVHDSKVIVGYLETLGRGPALLPVPGPRRVRVRQIESLADGVCDAVVLIVLERHRETRLQSADWIKRQFDKVRCGLAELEYEVRRCREAGDEWLVGNEFSVADIAVGCALAYVDFRVADHQWRADHPALVAFSEKLEARPSFQATRPAPQEIKPVG